MPQPNINNFFRKLWLSSGRDQLPEGSLRRCVGAAPEPSRSVVSRYGSALLYALSNIISLTKFNNVRYQYNGSILYKNGVSLDTGYNGGRLSFTKAPPAEGITDYLFLTGGGKNRKIDQAGNITNWGINNPLDGMQAALGTQDTKTIDTFDSSAANWTASNCTRADEATIVYEGAGSLKIVPTAGAWSITKDVSGSPLNLAVYANNDISLPSDYISLWVYMRQPNQVDWLWILFDVNAGDFKTDYYRLVVQVVPNTANVHAANAQVIISADADRWFQVAAPKSAFTRIGNTLNKDWSAVQKIRIEGGNPADKNPAPAIYVDFFQLFGGFGLGTGPAALTGGSTLQYLVTFGNDTTGNDSNPNDTPVVINYVVEQPVNLSHIPVSTDTQVTNRKLWRTSEGGSLFFFLDIIHDNTTTTYVDKVSSLPGQPIITTPWQAGATVVSGYYIDFGNGYYGKCTTGGVTGGTRPTFNTGTVAWTPLSTFDSTSEIVLPLKTTSNRAFQVQTTGKSGKTEPHWTTAGTVGNTITDGTVVWVNIGALTTTDNTAVWTTQGINALQTLGNTEVRYDNIIFPSTVNDATYFQGSMYVTRDTASGGEGIVYVSPPGRAEGYGAQGVLQVGTADDPCQKVVVWDELLFVFTQKYIYPLTGNYPSIQIGDHIQGAVGTTAPFTVKETPYGIVYQSAEDIRIFSRAKNGALGFEALAPIERGQTVENVAPFTAVIAEHTKDEALFSNGTVTFGYYFPDGGMWRMLGLGFGALYYEDDTGVIQAATSTQVLNYETSGVFTDNGTAISMEWQTPSILVSEGQKALVQRVFIDIDCNGQVITPTLLVDEALSPNSYTMPVITNTARGTIEIPFQKSCKIYAVRLTGSIIQRVQFYGIAHDISPSEA